LYNLYELSEEERARRKERGEREGGEKQRVMTEEGFSELG
jgi:hypothetical protein